MLVAIDELLSSKEGVNVTGLVNDLTLKEDERTETSIMIKLLLADKLKFDKDTRYSCSYGGDLIQYEYVQHSYIKNVVCVKETRFEYDEKSDSFLEKNTYDTTLDIDCWERTNKNYGEVHNNAKEIYIRKNHNK